MIFKERGSEEPPTHESRSRRRPILCCKVMTLSPFHIDHLGGQKTLGRASCTPLRRERRPRPRKSRTPETSKAAEVRDLGGFHRHNA